MSTADLAFTVHVVADEWAYTQRRTVYLQALLMRLVRDETSIKEWFSAPELAAMRLPGLALAPAGITRKASASRWLRQADAKGRWQYHVVSLPARAFDALLSRVLDMPAIEADALDGPSDDFKRVKSAPFDPQPKPPLPPNAAPPWVLPLMRLMKGSAGDLATAWRDLPAALPEGVALPTVEEAATILLHFGLAKP